MIEKKENIGNLASGERGKINPDSETIKEEIVRKDIIKNEKKEWTYPVGGDDFGKGRRWDNEEEMAVVFEGLYFKVFAERRMLKKGLSIGTTHAGIDRVSSSDTVEKLKITILSREIPYDLTFPEYEYKIIDFDELIAVIYTDYYYSSDFYSYKSKKEIRYIVEADEIIEKAEIPLRKFDAFDEHSSCHENAILKILICKNLKKVSRKSTLYDSTKDDGERTDETIVYPSYMNEEVR